MTRLGQIALSTTVALALLSSAAQAATKGAGPYEGTPDDFMQINQLFARYDYALDAHDAAMLTRSFAPDGVFRDPAWCAKGPAELAKVAGGPFDADADQKQHHVPSLGPIVYQDRNHATVHSTVMVIRETGGGVTGGGVWITGTYDDTLVRIGGKWVFAYRWVHRPSTTPAIACAGP